MSSAYRTYRGRNALLNIFELWVGLAGIITALVYISNYGSLGSTSLALVLGHRLAFIWAVAYGVSGAMIWLGLLVPTPRWEIAGLCLLGGATGINGVAVIYTFHMQGIATSVTFLTLAVAAWTRASLVYARASEYARKGLYAGRGC